MKFAATHLHRSAWFREGLVYLAISIWFCAPLFDEPLALGREDWDQHLFYPGQVLKNVIEFGTPPFWSPWYCGGNVMWQNPQVGLLSPVLPLAMVMPLSLAMKLNILLHYWVGFIGMHVLITRVIGLSSSLLAICLATLFTTSGAIAAHLAIGHSVFLPVMYLPLMLSGLIQALKSGRVSYALLAGGALALMAWNGGVHVLPMAVIPAGLIVLIAAAVTRRWRPIVLGASFLLFGLSYAAPKLYPAVLFVTGQRLSDSRPFPSDDHVPFEMVSSIYLEPKPWRDTDVRKAMHVPWSRWEYENYVGPFSAAMLLVGLVGGLGYSRRAPDRWLGMGLAATAAICFMLSLGHFAPWAPASLLSQVPLASSFRIPSRFSIPFILFATLSLAWTLRGPAVRALGRRVVRVPLTVLFLLSLAHVTMVNRDAFSEAFNLPPLDVSFKWLRRPTQFTVDKTTTASPQSDDSPMLRALASDRLFLRCFEPLQLRRTAKPESPAVFSDGNRKIEIARFMPNRVEFDAGAGESTARVYLNTNWSPGWHSNAGKMISPDDEPPYVILEPDQQGRFAFWFIPEGLWSGVSVFVAGLAVSIVVARRRC